MAERSLVDYVLRGMRGKWDGPVKHADAFTPGIADLSGYVTRRGNVFIELKAADRWPKYPSTPVQFGFDDLQREFLKARRGWLFVRVGREYLLFDWKNAYAVVDRPGATQRTLKYFATKVWVNKVNWKEFERCINLKIE